MNPRPRAFSAGVVVVHESRDGWRFLLLRAFRYWDFPKGGVEPGEQPLAAARREVAEETGIVDLDFRWGEACFDTAPYSRGKVARYYVAAAPDRRVVLPVNPAIGRAEHSEYRWLAREEALALAAPRIREVIVWASALLESPA